MGFETRNNNAYSHYAVISNRIRPFKRILKGKIVILSPKNGIDEFELSEIGEFEEKSFKASNFCIFFSL